MSFLFDESPAQGEAGPSGSGLSEAPLALWVALRGPLALWRHVLALLSEGAVCQYLGGSSVPGLPEWSSLSGSGVIFAEKSPSSLLIQA